VREVPHLEQGDAFQRMTRLSGELFRSKEAAEGVAAFVTKRKPAWAVDDDA
jgi:enoyl-CoA hydratase/carnithine racemase